MLCSKARNHGSQLNFLNSSMKHTPKAAFRALKSSLKPSKPLLTVLKTDHTTGNIFKTFLPRFLQYYEIQSKKLPSRHHSVEKP